VKRQPVVILGLDQALDDLDGLGRHVRQKLELHDALAAHVHADEGIAALVEVDLDVLVVAADGVAELVAVGVYGVERDDHRLLARDVDVRDIGQGRRRHHLAAF
jgi:hypothetical protein